MPSFGYSLMCELYGPNELLAQAARAEEAGFDFVTISDHFHPWLFSHRHSPLCVQRARRARGANERSRARFARHLPDDSLPPGDRGSTLAGATGLEPATSGVTGRSRDAALPEWRTRR
jgi:hypothetical protein